MVDGNSFGRFAAAPWLLAVLLLVSACESSPLGSLVQGTSEPSPLAAPRQGDSPAPDIAVSPGPARLPLDAPAPAPSAAAPAPAAAMAAPPAPVVAKNVPSVPRAALLVPLSGPQSGLGSAMLNAAQLAMFDLAGSDFELLPHDTRGTPEGALEAANRAISEGASIILGPLLAPSIRAIGPTARASNVPMIAFSSDRSTAASGVFVMGFFPEAEVERVVSHARAKGLSRFAALAPDDEYGMRIVTALRQAVGRSGGTITRIAQYSPQTRDFADLVRNLARYDERHGALAAQRKLLSERNDEISKRALRRLETLQTLGDLPFDALLVADGGERLRAIAAFLPYYDIDPAKVRILGTGLWDVPWIGTEPALVGGWFAGPNPTARAEFEKKYADVYGDKPPRRATLAYDATALAAILARAEGGPDFRVETLTNPSGFFGRDGIFRFAPGGPVERGLSVLEVGPKTITVVDPAPEVFPAPGS